MDSDTSESGESEDNLNYQNRQFNTRETKEVEKCVTEVLKLIKKALKKDTECRKEPIKTIRKETKKAKPKKKEVIDQIKRLCKAIKAIASTPADPVAEVSLRLCEEVPGTSRSKTEKTPGKLRYSMEGNVPETSRISNNYFETTKSVQTTPQSNTELVVFGNVRNRADPKTLVSNTIRDHESIGSGITAGSGIPGSFMERDSGPSRSYLQPRIPESLRRIMEVSKPSTSHLNVAESGTLRQTETVALEISKGSSKIQLVFSKSAAVSTLTESENHVETFNNRSVIHLGTVESHPKALFGISENRAIASSLRSLSETEICDAQASSSDAAVTNTSRNMKTVPEISSDSINTIPRTTKSLIQTTLEPLKNCTGIIVTVSDSFTKPVKEASKTHQGADGSCNQANPGTLEPLAETGIGSSRSLSKIKDPESSRRNTETEVSEATVRSSYAAVSDTSRNMKTVAPEISSDSTNSFSGTFKSPIQTAPEPSKNCIKIVNTEISDNFTKPDKEASKTHNATDGSCIQEIPGAPKTLVEADTGPSRSLSKTKAPESSKRNTETDVSEAPARSSYAAVSDTLRNMKTVVPEISSDSTNIITGTSKSPTQTAPEPSKNCTKIVATEISDSFTKPDKEALKTYHVTDGSCIQAIPGAPETLAEAGTGPSRSLFKTKTPKSSRRNTKTEITSSCLDVAQSRNSRHTKTIVTGTSSCRTNAIPERPKSDSNAVASGTPSNEIAAISPGTYGSDNTAIVYGLLNKRDDNIPHKESHSQICTKISKSYEINNNSTSKRKIEANLKRNHTISNNDDPKRAKIDHKCSLCGEVINHEDLSKHYKERHGMRHEIKHNNENYEHKIQDLNKRLQNPIYNSKLNNEQKDKITTESKKITAARSLSAPNEGTEQTVANSTVVINVDSDEVEEPAEKKKGTAPSSGSALNKCIEQTNATTLKSETSQPTVLDDAVIDLTNDINLSESKPPTHVIVQKWIPKPVDDDQILNDHQFVDLSDDTSLYEIPDVKEIKFAEALLLENVKEEQEANYHDVEVISNYSPKISNNKSSDKKCRKTTDQSRDNSKQTLAHQESVQKVNKRKSIVPESSRRGIEIVGLINSTKDSSRDHSMVNPETDKEHTKVTKRRTSINPTKTNAPENSVCRTKVSFGTVGNCTELRAGTSVPPSKTIEFSKNLSKEPAIPINQHVIKTKQSITQHDCLKRRNDKPKHKWPYEKPNNTNTNRISSANIATKTSVNAPKVAMRNATITQVTTTNKSISVEKKTSNSKETNINQLNTDKVSTGTVPTRFKPDDCEVTIVKTTDLSIQKSGKATHNSAQKRTFNSKNTNEFKTDFFPGIAIKTVDAPKESLPNTTSVSLPNSTTITPTHATQKANQTSASNCSNATGVSNSMTLPPTPSTNIISTSNLVKSAIQQQSVLQKFHTVMANFPPGPTNIASQKLNSVTQNTSTRISTSASASPPSLQNNAANVSLQTNHQTGLPVIKSNQRRPLSSTSQFCDIARNTQNVTNNIKSTSSLSVQSAPKQHSNRTARIKKSGLQSISNTPRRKSVPAFDQSDRKKTTNFQSPQITWYPPFLLGDQYTLSSNVAPRNINRRASFNLNDAHPQTYRWHTPVEPENERPEASTIISESVTLNNLSLSFSNPVESRHQSNSQTTVSQRPNNQRMADARQQSSNSEVGWQNLLTPRHQSTLLQDQGLRLPQTNRTWHTPVKGPTQN